MDLQRTKYDPARFTFGTFLSQAEGNVFQEGDRERYRNEDPWIMKKKDEVDWEVEAEEEHDQISRGDSNIQKDDLLYLEEMKRDEDSNRGSHSQGNDLTQSHDRSEDVEFVPIRKEMLRSTHYPSTRKPVVELGSKVDRGQEEMSVNDADVSPNDDEMKEEGEGEEGEKYRSTDSPTLPVLPFDQHYQLVLFTTVESFGKKVPFQSLHLHP